MKLGILGLKLGMTQIFEDKRITPVTVVEATPNTILRVKTAESDGYHALKLGLGDAKPSRVRRPDAGQTKAAGCGPKQFIRELRLDGAAGEEYAVGGELKVDLFSTGDKVDVTDDFVRWATPLLGGELPRFAEFEPLYAPDEGLDEYTPQAYRR